MNLIQAQDDHISRLLNAKEYASNNSMGDLTPLRRKLVSVRASRIKFRKDLRRMGYTNNDAISAAMSDAEDIAILEYQAD